MIIVGNGLGMALDPYFFNLGNAIREVWTDFLSQSPEQKMLIASCFETCNDLPKSEQELEKLNNVDLSCRALKCIKQNSLSLLSEEGEAFPDIAQNFRTAVAWHFHKYKGEFPDEFIDPLTNHIINRKSHIVTLNYDNLLYQKLIQRKILNGYSGQLVDGFWNSCGFNEEHLTRKGNNCFGYYLHLHGSPLFIDSGGKIIKQSQCNASPIPTPHLVLTHPDGKEHMIENSPVLKTYWRLLKPANQESNITILFGYSGLDNHLNCAIKLSSQKRKIFIVEWEGAGHKDDRMKFWQQNLAQGEDQGNIELIRMKNILDFQNWDDI